MRALVVLALLASNAHAEPWYRGRYGRQRAVHLSITAGAGVAYALSEGPFKSALAPAQCRWCSVDSVDAHIRNSIVWKDAQTAVVLSNVDGYVATPLAVLGLSLAGSLTSDDTSWARVIDDGLPVLESVALSQVPAQIVKFSVGRQRPYAHFNPTTPDLDDNVSFFSAHSALVCALVTSSGSIAHRRGYWTEPYIWAGGGVLALSTMYFRMAGDKHYFTDILTGASVGTAAGLLVPRLMDRGLTVAPARDGVAVVGRF
jgi:membrane-associated phospholipid phosphatase